MEAKELMVGEELTSRIKELRKRIEEIGNYL